jgi:ubiquitin carboxyl-terminal hydrolase 36/42
MNGFGGGKPKGFSNLGNTCYLNSTIQCLAYIPPFCQSLLTMSTDRKINQGENAPLPAGKRITMMMKSLFTRVHAPIENTVSSIAPRKLVNALPTLSKIGSRGGYQFRPGRQEDSHEFLGRQKNVH